MKICPKCNTGNNEDLLQCKDCGYSLVKLKKENRDYFKDFEDSTKRKHRRKILIHTVALVVLGLCYTYFSIQAYLKVSAVELILLAILLPIISYLNINHPKALFIVRNFFTIDNIDDVELSDIYIFMSKLSGYLILIFGIIFMAACTFFE